MQTIKNDLLLQKTEKRWFALYVRSRYENKVASDLQQIGFDTWVPVLRTLRQWSDRKKWVDVPLFRSYVFVYASVQKVRMAAQADGAVYVVSFSGEPVAIPDVQMENLRLLLDSSEKFEISFDEFNFGEQIEITKGSLKGIKGTFVDFKGKKRLLMYIDAVNQKLLIDINPGHVKKISAHETVA